MTRRLPEITNAKDILGVLDRTLDELGQLATLGDPEKRLTIELSEPETNAIAFASSFVLTHFQAMLSLAGPGTFSKIYNHYAPTLKALSERLEEITEYHRRHDGRPRELPYYHEFGPCTLNPDLCNLCHQPKSSTWHLPPDPRTGWHKPDPEFDWHEKRSEQNAIDGSMSEAKGEKEPSK